MTKVQRFNEIIRSRSDFELEEMYNMALARFYGIEKEAANIVAGAIESEFSRRHGWEACEAMTERAGR